MRAIQTTAAFGSAVRRARKDSGLTQAELAARAGVGRPWLSELEGGKQRAELGRVLAVVGALDLALALIPAPTPDPGGIDLDRIIGDTTR